MAGQEYIDAAAKGMAEEAAARKEKREPSARTKELRAEAAKEAAAEASGGEDQGPPPPDPLAVDAMPPDGTHSTGAGTSYTEDRSSAVKDAMKLKDAPHEDQGPKQHDAWKSARRDNPGYSGIGSVKREAYDAVSAEQDAESKRLFPEINRWARSPDDEYTPDPQIQREAMNMARAWLKKTPDEHGDVTSEASGWTDAETPEELMERAVPTALAAQELAIIQKLPEGMERDHKMQTLSQMIYAFRIMDPPGSSFPSYDIYNRGEDGKVKSDNKYKERDFSKGGRQQRTEDAEERTRANAAQAEKHKRETEE
jgi:hypothetical protein